MDASYTVITGSNVQVSNAVTLAAIGPFAGYWLLPRRKLPDASEADWVVSYGGDRLGTALRELPPVLLDFDRWLLTVPLVVLAASALVRRRPELAAYAVGTVVLGFLGFATVYWASSYPLDWYIDTTAERIVSSLAVFGAALFPLLVSEALEAGPGGTARDG